MRAQAEELVEALFARVEKAVSSLSAEETRRLWEEIKPEWLRDEEKRQAVEEDVSARLRELSNEEFAQLLVEKLDELERREKALREELVQAFGRWIEEGEGDEGRCAAEE